LRNRRRRASIIAIIGIIAHYPRHYSPPAYGDYGAQNMFAENARSGRNYASQNYSDQVYPQRSAYGGQIGAHIGGRPAAWCGWEMRQLVSGDPGPAFNLARNWAHWGQAGLAGIGAVVVWSHHVGKIVGQEDGKWIIESGNDGNRVRTRPLSPAGAIAIRWG
jgi:hypothetical protein